MAETQLDLLIEVYKEAQLRLIKIITGNSGAGTKTYYNTVLTQLERLMKQLSAETGKYINTAVPSEYKKALDETYDYFQRNKLLMKRPDMFAQIHSDAVNELAREMQYHINQGISQAGRRVMRYLDESRDNILRQQGLRASAVKIASGQTVKDMQKDLIQRLSREGFFTVQYGSGKKAYQVGLDAYAAMVARSTTREAGNLAREKQLSDNGYDLMIMTEHYPTCGLCAMLQGRVYSISGKDKRFPPLSRAFQSGYRNVHPNCRHVMTYWVESMQSPEELREALRKSNAPFTDSRSDDERALYSKQQADNRRMRADRSQFERYRARLGDEAPKTFTQFRKLKKQGGEKWDEMQKLYRSKFPNNSTERNLAKQIEFFNVDAVPSNTAITPEAIEQELNNSEIGREILEYIKGTNVKPKLIYKRQYHSNRGEQWGDNIKIFIDNIQSPLVGAQTVIHEITHHKYGISNCRWAEAVCMAKEKMHKENRTYLTIAEKRYIVGLANKFYGEYNWKKGGKKYGKPIR